MEIMGIMGNHGRAAHESRGYLLDAGIARTSSQI
jgi:hypothetical protein